jgi:hypothetical protein
MNIVKYHDMNRTMFIEKLTEVQQIVEQLLAQLQASEHDKFAAHIYRSRREYRSACETGGKSGKQIEQIAESMGFQGDFRPMGTIVADRRLKRFALAVPVSSRLYE